MRDGSMNEKSDGLLVLAELGETCRRNLRTFVVLGLLGLLCGLLLLSRKSPVYRVEATMLLDTNRSAGVLGELAALTSAPQAVSEMEILRSRGLARAVVDGQGGSQGVLTTLVDSGGLSPLNSLVGSDTVTEWRELGERPRLAAQVVPDPRRLRQPVLTLEFLGPRRVRIGQRHSLFGFGVGGVDAIEVDFQLGHPVEYDGLSLRLVPDGDLSGETFHLHSLRPEEAVEMLEEGLRVSETERNSGVIRVTYEDSDPERASATVNALCGLYLERNEARNAKRASQTVEFIEKQLEEQIKALEEAEREVVELQSNNPKSVNITATGEALIGQLTSMQVEEVQLRMLLNSLQEALERLHEGDIAALSRLESELADPVTLSYIQQIAQLTAESALLGRTDAGAYKGLVMNKRLQLETESERLGLFSVSLEKIVERLEGGDNSALGGLESLEEAGELDPLLHNYLKHWSELDQRLRSLAVDFTDELPEMKTLKAQRADLEARLLELLEGRLASYEVPRTEYAQLLELYDGRVGEYPVEEDSKITTALERLEERTVEHLTQRLTGLYSRLSRLKDERLAVEASLAELPEEVRILADPMRRRDAHTEIVQFLLGRQKEAEITRAATIATADFIDAATPARAPRGPFAPLFLFGGLVLGLGVAFGLATLRQAFDRGVYTNEELELASGLPLFGSIPDYKRGPCKMPGAGDDFLALRDAPEGPVAEAYRSLRSNLKFVLNSGKGDLEIRTLAFTSCTQSEGKSITNVDMALAFAMTGRRVLLVDADMRRPRVHKYLKTELSPGFSDVLKGEASWRQVVKHDQVQNVDVITAGRQPSSPGDLLAGEITEGFLQEVREAYDLVVFDVPPALAVADIDCLASRLDALLLVTRSGKLSNKVVREGARRLQQVGANLVGCVLNCARPTRGEQKYGYGYGYGYGGTDSDAA